MRAPTEVCSRHIAVVALQSVAVFRVPFFRYQPVHRISADPGRSPMLGTIVEDVTQRQELRLCYIAPTRALALAAIRLDKLGPYLSPLESRSAAAVAERCPAAVEWRTALFAKFQ